jgi:hypothetical protein
MSRYSAILQAHASQAPFTLEQLLDKGGTLEILLSGRLGGALVVSFDSYLAYRKMDEGDAMVALSQVASVGLQGRSFYQVEESDYHAWFLAQSYGIHEASAIGHFAVHALNDVVDVLALEAPRISHVPSSVQQDLP